MRQVPAIVSHIREVAGLGDQEVTRANRADFLDQYAAAKTIILMAGVCVPADGEYSPQELAMSQRYYELEARVAPGLAQAANLTRNVPPHPTPHFVK